MVASRIRKPRARSPKPIGWRERVSFPDFEVIGVKAKIDSGAQTSSIHGFRPRFSQKDDGEWVSFEIHPRRRSRKDAVRVTAKVKTRRRIRSSNGESELRPVIETTMTVGGETFIAELTLANRHLMAYRMILGRSAMRGRFTIDPSKSYLFGE
ncbi:MAG: RimK/LysX family protein [Dehalococcoidia bacterium]|nr:RimK/LysX family protein [Dehalococcoidia bacterium]